MAGTPQRFRETGQTAVQNRGRPHQADVTLSMPHSILMSEHWSAAPKTT